MKNKEKSKSELLSQLEKLDYRLGKGQGAVKERAKIAAKLAKFEEQNNGKS